MKRMLMTLLVLLAASAAYPQTINWDADNAVGNFSYCDNWYGNSCPTSYGGFNYGNILQFNYRNNGSQTSVFYDLSWNNIKALQFMDTYGQSTPLNGNGNGLNFDTKIENLSFFAQTVNIPLSGARNGSASIELDPTNANLTIGGPVYNDNNKPFNIYGGVSAAPNNKLIINGSLAGNGSVSLNINPAKVASQYPVVDFNSNTSTFGGGVNINKGECWFESGAAINGGTITVGSGDANTAKLYINAAGGTTISNTITVPAGSSGSYIGGLNSTGTNTYSGQVNLNGAAGFETVSGGTIDFTGNITGAGNLSIGRVSGVGTATIRFSSLAKSYTGTTTVTNGAKLQVSVANAIPAGNTITLNAGGTLQISADQIIGNLSVPAGSTLLVDAGKTLTITGTFTGGGTITNNGTVVMQGSSLQSFPGTGSVTMNALTVSNSAGITLDADLSINGSLSLSAGSLNLNGKTLTLNGSLTGGGTLTGSASSSLVIGGTGLNQLLSFNQASADTRTLKNLTLNSGATASLTNALQITAGTSPGTVTVNSGANLSTGGNLTLKSDDDGTARVASSAGTISGDVTVERNIRNAGHRAWHLLSTNTSGSQTIYDAWQEGGANVANSGTLITSNLYTGSNGFDMSSNSASILTHNQGGLSGPSWNYNLGNTNSTVLAAYPGYMLFVRGDRNYTPTLPTPTATNRTVLRSKGSLKQGTLPPVTVSATGTGRTLVGNPYASPIDMETVFTGTANLNPDMYVWDPAATGNYGVGAFVLVERNGGNYQQTPYGGSATADANSRYIASGQAFFLKATGADASVVFNENMKVANTPTVNPFVRSTGEQQLYVNLLLDNEAAGTSLADGIRVRFNDVYTTGSADDIEKMGNFGENISVYRNAKKWIVEKRPLIGKRDTIYLRLGNMANRKYQLRIAGIDFVQQDITAYLEDSYTGKRVWLDVSGKTNDISFSVSTDAGSANPDRFRIVFTRALAAPADNPAISGVMVYPNPVMAGPVRVNFSNMPAGLYTMRLMNDAGQLFSNQSVNHKGANTMYSIMVSNLVAGSYRLEVTDQQGRTAVKMVYVL